MGFEVPGELALRLALVFDVVAGVAFLLAARGRSSASLARKSYHLFAASTAVAVVYLFYLFFSHNYAFKYVYEYNESTQPLIYIISGFWGGQEGTYLLWLFFNAIFGYIILRRGGVYRNDAMAVFSLVNLFFLLIMTKLSPFALLPAPAADGLGLNPLLRDPWMVIHPPVMFSGYAMAAVPFCMAMAALIRNDFSQWVPRVFPWVAVTALMLGAGNILGGYWAYKTLGWGGYWGWDPVENSSFVPWVIALSLLHGLIIERRSGALRKTNLLLTAFLFLLVVYGTFLTRSGVLADFSVHSFTDLGINGYLVGFLALFFVVSLGLFFWRARLIETRPLSYNIYGREFSMFSAMVILFLFGTIVLFWSSLPILTSWFSSQPSAADVPTYNRFALPLAVMLAFLLTVSPLTSFSTYRLPGGLRRAAVILGGAALLAVVVSRLLLSSGLVAVLLYAIVAGGTLIFMLKPDWRKTLSAAVAMFVVVGTISYFMGVRNPVYLIFLATAAMAVTTNLISVTGFLPGRWRQMGGELTHFGFGLMLIGVLASSAMGTSEKLVIPRGQTAQADLFGLTVGYQGMAHDIRYPNNELILSLTEKGDTREVRPQLYYSRRMDGIMRKPFISRSLLFDYYLAPEQIQETGQDEHLSLAKGQTRSVQGVAFTFNGFEMAQHDADANAMRVIAKITVKNKGSETDIQPAVVHAQDSNGQPQVTSEPASIQVDGRVYQVLIDRILADQGVVVMSVPGLLGNAASDRLILDVSKKPLIGLVWLGTTLIVLGAILVVRRRREELVRIDYNETARQAGENGHEHRDIKERTRS